MSIKENTLEDIQKWKMMKGLLSLRNYQQTKVSHRLKFRIRVDKRIKTKWIKNGIPLLLLLFLKKNYY